MMETGQTLRLEIDGEWTAAEMGFFLNHLNDLHNVKLVLTEVRETWGDFKRFYGDMIRKVPFHGALEEYERLRERRGEDVAILSFKDILLNTDNLTMVAHTLYPRWDLRVVGLSYGSPGWVDIIGLNDIVLQLRDLFNELISFRTGHQPHEHHDPHASNILAKRTDVARRFVQLAHECGCTEKEVEMLVAWAETRLETIDRLIRGRKILAIGERMA